MYISVTIHDTIVEALVDTGATCTILHPKTYVKLAQTYNLTEKYEGHSNLKGADGKPIQTDGIIELDLTIGQNNYTQNIVIADVEVPIVIGLDFLHHNKAQIDIVNSSISLHGERINCRLKDKSPAVYKIQLAQDTTVPPGSEIIVKGATDSQDISFDTGMVESLNDVWERQSVNWQIISHTW